MWISHVIECLDINFLHNAGTVEQGGLPGLVPVVVENPTEKIENPTKFDKIKVKFSIVHSFFIVDLVIF